MWARAPSCPSCVPASHRFSAAGVPLVGIAEGTYIDGAIIDKNCRIGRNVRVCNDHKVNTSEETPEAMIADGIVVVQKGATLRDGWHL